MQFSPFRPQPLVVLFLISVLILPAIIFYPFHSDIDIQQVMGFELFRFHGLPYLATWDSNFPGTIVIHAVAIAVFGNSEIALRIMDVIVQIGVIIILYNISRFWLEKFPALLGVALYALFYVRGPGQYMSQKDCFAILPILLTIGACVLAFRTDRPIRRNALMLCSGAFAGLAFWMRPTFGLLLVTPFISLFDLRSRAGRQAFVFEALGFALILALGLLPYAMTPHGLQEIYLATIRYNYEIYSHTFSNQDRSPRTWVALGFIVFWALTVLRHKRQHRESIYKPKSHAEIRFLIATISALLIGVLVMRRLASYHFAPFFACFMPVLAAVIWETQQSFRWKRTGIVLTIAVAVIALYPWKLAAAFFSSCHSYSSLVQRFDKHYDGGVDGVAAVFIEQHSHPEDTIEVASFTPRIRWRIDRPFGTRYTTPQPLFVLAPDKKFTEYQIKWRREYVDDIANPRTKFYIIDDARYGSTSVMGILMTVPGLQDVIKRDYRLDTIIGTYYIYARR